ncbi:hypothetical protein EVAR_83710_1 [Eumeta japonica]|uniref:Uncharacterized protein n=1 Tax=Eumeta variegata TaxID=151549 RepID=A0A4C1WC08_EUMVA|nr:hypothetical protein EVAR_83710_1 [Eumeta japonica]
MLKRVEKQAQRRIIPSTRRNLPKVDNSSFFPKIAPLTRIEQIESSCLHSKEDDCRYLCYTAPLASSHARASQKYGSRLSLERGGYGLRVGTPMSGAERVGRFQKRRKVASVDDAVFAINSSAAVSVAI